MPLFRRALLILLLIAVMGGAAAVYQLLPAPETRPLAQGTLSEAAPKEIFVHVSGAVQRAGVVKLREGARAQEAIEACGGLLPQADVQGVNLAQVLKDGMLLRVPAAVEKAVTQEEPHGKAGKGGKVNINTADVQGLQALKGIGPALAQRILDYRTANGAFQRAEDLLQVKGIGQAKFDKLKEQIVL